MTEAEYDKARRLLMRRDPILASAIKKIGPCGMAARQRKDHLTALVGAIVSQQLSTKAAATIFGRFAALFPTIKSPMPQRLRQSTTRRCGARDSAGRKSVISAISPRAFWTAA
jgi:3-methyladenine DNA glycosylase/8-oxoguanine DNA glycosylase